MAAGADVVRAAVAVLPTPEGILNINVDVTKLGKIPAPPVARARSAVTLAGRGSGTARLGCGLRGAATGAVVPACSVIASSAAHAEPVATTATVLKVVDGDPVDIVDDVRGRLRIRLLGIDTPETNKPAKHKGKV